MSEWQSIFLPTVPVVDGIARGTITFLALLAFMRIVGQRESGGLGITDVLLVVLVTEAAAPGLHGDAKSVADGLIVVATILFWSVAVDAVAFCFPTLGRFIKARPRPLIADGRLNRRVMRREFMTSQEMDSQLRLHGIEDVGLVERAYTEPNGMISILRRDGEPTEPVEPPEGQ
jgi:uncharacterized membrane protein YcaP (DUF421 family)